MSGNAFGRYFRIVTFGESRGPTQGVVIDGVPPQLVLDLPAVEHQLARWSSGALAAVATLPEPEQVTVLSGLFEGKTTGVPLCLLVSGGHPPADDVGSFDRVFLPGQGDLGWYQKYGVRGWRGGRDDPREALSRVAARAVARQILDPLGVLIRGHSVQIGGVRALSVDLDSAENNELRCADPDRLDDMREAVETARRDGDSVGGVVELRADGVPPGWGDPVFAKLEACLGAAMMSIGGVRGVEVGDGFALTRMRGSEANDAINPEGFDTNHSGGILGGISNGDTIVVRVAVRPTPDIAKPQCTVDTDNNPTVVATGGSHNPCTVPQLVPVAEAMMALALVDAHISHRAICGGT